MQFSDLSKWSLEHKARHTLGKVWANGCRFLLGAAFLFSGFVKANDPTGVFYKLQEYAEAFHVHEALPTVLLFLSAIALGVVEFSLGIYLIFGIRRNGTSRLTLLLLSFFTPLTLWLALANPIQDCGCFGDAILLGNWQTFWKNMVLWVAAVSVFRGRHRLFKLVSHKVDWLIGLYSMVFILFYALYCLHTLPVFDFRPYHIGADIRKGMEMPPDQHPTVYETTFIYARNGQEQEFTIDKLPSDSTWTFINAKTTIKEQGYEPPIHDFSITLQEDGTDVTDEVLDDPGYTFLLIMPHVAEADDSNIDLVNEVYDYCVENSYRFICLTASSDEDINRWQEDTGAEYPFARTDDVTLNTMIRANPGLMLLRKGVILHKWGADEFPDEYDLSAPLERLTLGQSGQKTVVRQIMEVLGWFIGPLLALSLCDALWKMARARRNQKQTTH